MSAGEEFEDDRCPGGEDDDSRVSFGPGYIDDLTAITDEQVKDTALDLLVPDLDGRWPEPRALWQDEVFFLRDRTRIDVAALAPVDAGWLLSVLEELGPALHAAAARDEALTTSSGLRRAMAAAGVPAVADLDPLEWLAGTVLVRRLVALRG